MPREANFTRTDWALLTAVAAMWGSSFLFIGVGVDHFAPALVALLRVAFGAAVLSAVPAARRRVPRSDWPAIAVLGAVWMAGPFVLFGIAEQSIDSSLAGMLNGAVPIFAAVTAAILLRRLPASRQLIGIAVGFLVRSAATAIGLLLGLLMLAPLLVDLVPGTVGETLTKIVPSNAGEAMMSVTARDSLLSPLPALAVLVAWVVGLLAIAAVTVRRRDA